MTYSTKTVRSLSPQCPFQAKMHVEKLICALAFPALDTNSF